MGIKVQKIAEDARECAPEEAPAPLLNKMASIRGPVLHAGHDVGKEVEVARVVTLMQVRSALIANNTQGIVGPNAQALEHGAVLVFQCQVAALFT